MGKAIWAVVLGLSAGAPAASATELVLHLNGAGPVRTTAVRYRCDAHGAEMGLPAGEFAVRYVNGAGNSLAVLRVGGMDTVFANVISADGARYVAGRYVWWSARETSFALAGGGTRSVCREVKAGVGVR